ncbi:MAG: hypothetical protein NWF02_08840, partial [Candidatus Bathyarchaeota archaeon]|nr:hypothetical protein [Candidatus Bathyarchaeum sp.]
SFFFYYEKAWLLRTGYCMPCPEGVNIPQNFACLNNAALETNRLRRIMAKRAYKKLVDSKKIK